MAVNHPPQSRNDTKPAPFVCVCSHGWRTVASSRLSAFSDGQAFQHCRRCNPNHSERGVRKEIWTLYRKHYLELPIAHDGTGILSVQVFLICHSSPKFLLAQHFSECYCVVVGINANNFSSLGIVSFELVNKVSAPYVTM